MYTVLWDVKGVFGRMLAVERRNKILELLTERDSASVSDLSKRYHVTEETIRKDLDKLEVEGFIRRTHGGAFKVPDIGQELPFSVRNLTNLREKKLIAREAAKLVSDDDVIVLDPSSTALQLAYELKNKKKVTVVTNSLNVLNALKDTPSIHVFCIGGILQVHSLCFVGEAAEDMLKRHVINKVFISTRGITLKDGLLEPNEQEARMKKTMIELAEEVVVLQDHSKFGKSAFHPIAQLDQVDCLITDEGVPDEYIDRMEELSKRIIVTTGEGPTVDDAMRSRN